MKQKWNKWIVVSVLPVVFTLLCLSCSNLFGRMPSSGETGGFAVHLNWNTEPTAQRCMYPATEGITFTYTLLNNDETKSPSGIEGPLTGATGDAYTVAKVPVGTYYVRVDGFSGTTKLLSGVSTSPFSVTGSGSPAQAAVALAWLSDASSGTASLHVTIVSAYAFAADTVFTASFKPSGTGTTATTFSSSGTAGTALVFTDTGKTDAGYTYTVSGTALPLVSGTYTVSLTAGTNQTDLLSGEDTSVVVASGLTTALNYSAAAGYSMLFVKNGGTGTGTVGAPFGKLSDAFDAAAAAAGPVQIALLGNYTAEEKESEYAGSNPVVLNLRGYAVTASASYPLLTCSGTGAVTVLNGTIAGSQGINPLSYLIGSTRPDITLSNVSVTMGTSLWPAVVAAARLNMIDSSVSYTANDAQEKAVDITAYAGEPGGLYVSETGAGKTFVANGYVGLSAGAVVTAESALAAELVAAVQPTFVMPSQPATVFGSTAHITTTQWPLAGNEMKYNSDMTVSLIPGDGYMYTYDSVNNSYSVNTGTFGSTGSFTVVSTDKSVWNALDTSFDNSGFFYMLRYNGDFWDLETPVGSFRVTGLPSPAAGIQNGVPVSIAADGLLNRIIIAEYDANAAVKLYKIESITGGQETVTATDLTASLPLESNESLKKIAYNETEKKLYAIVRDSFNSVDYLKQYEVSDLTFSPGVTLTLQTKAAFTFDNMYGSTLIATKKLTLSDMNWQGDYLYILASCVDTTLSNLYGQYSIGEVIALRSGYTVNNTTNTVQVAFNTYGMFANSNGNIKTNVDALLAGWNYTPTGAWKAGNSTAKTTMFYGPERIVALTPERIVISDTGFELSDTQLNKIKRTMLFDIGTSTLTAGTVVNDYSFTRKVMKGSSMSAVTVATNGTLD